MRKFLLAACALALMAPVSLLASQVDFSSVGGTVTASGGVLSTTTASTLNAVAGSSMSVTGANIGTINFTTGDMSSGNLSSGGMFSPGGSITVATNGNFTGDTNDPSAFSGSFGWLTWTSLGNNSYSLDGEASGTFSNAFASLFGLTSDSGSGLFISGEVYQSGSTYSLTSIDLSVPEAQTLLLLGVGLLGLVVLRRKFALAAQA